MRIYLAKIFLYNLGMKFRPIHHVFHFLLFIRDINQTAVETISIKFVQFLIRHPWILENHMTVLTQKVTSDKGSINKNSRHNFVGHNRSNSSLWVLADIFTFTDRAGFKRNHSNELYSINYSEK